MPGYIKFLAKMICKLITIYISTYCSHITIKIYKVVVSANGPELSPSVKIYIK